MAHLLMRFLWPGQGSSKSSQSHSQGASTPPKRTSAAAATAAAAAAASKEAATMTTTSTTHTTSAGDSSTKSRAQPPTKLERHVSSGRLSEDEDGFLAPWTPISADPPASKAGGNLSADLPGRLSRKSSSTSLEGSVFHEPIVPPDKSSAAQVRADVGGDTSVAGMIDEDHDEHPPLLWESVAYAISTLATTARISIRAAALVAETALEGAKYGTTVGFGMGRTALVGALLTARAVHGRVSGIPNLPEPKGLLTAGSGSAVMKADEEPKPEHLAIFHNALDKYTRMSINVVNESFTLAELFTLATFHLTTKAATETVGIIDGLFGSTETSRALAAFVTFLRKELNEWNDGQGVLPGKGVIGKTFSTIALLGGVSKSLTAFACLQYMTQKRTLDGRKVTTIYEGLVPIVDENNGAGSDTESSGDGDLVLQWSHEENSELLIEIEETRRKVLGDRADAKSEARALMEDAKAFREGVQVMEEARSFIEEARSLRGGMETLNDADSLISDARSVRSRLTLLEDAASSVYSRNSEYGPETPGTEEDDQEQREFLWNIATDFRGGPRRRLDFDEDSDASVEMEDEPPSPSLSDTERELASARARAAAETASIASSIQSDSAGSSGSGILRNIRQKLRRNSAGSPPPSPPINGVSPAHSRKSSSGDSASHSRKPSVGAAIGSAIKGLVKHKGKSSKKSGRRKSDSEGPANGHGLPSPTGSVKDVHEVDRPIQNAMSKSQPNIRGLNGRTSMGSVRTTRSSIILQIDSISTEQEFSDGTVHRTGQLRLNQKQLKSYETNVAGDGGSGPGLDHRPRHKVSRTPSDPGKWSADSEGEHIPPLPAAPRRNSTASSLRLHMTPLRTTSNSSREALSAKSPLEPALTILPPPGEPIWPFPTLIANLDRYVRFSTGAYGRHFMRAIGVGRLLDVVSQDPHHPANHYAFSIHTKIPLSCILLSTYTNQDPIFNTAKMQPLGHFVVLDHDARAVVVTLRGTLGLSDALTDLAVDHENWDWCGETYRVHKGMMRAAKVLARKEGSFFRTVKKALEEHPNYGLVLCGHSLGGGVASLLALMWSCPTPKNLSVITPFVTSDVSGLPPSRPTHCFTYGPASTVCHELCVASRGLITSCVNGDDVLPTISLGLVRDFKTLTMVMLDPVNKGLAERVIGKTLGWAKQEGTSGSTSRGWWFGGGSKKEEKPTPAETLTEDEDWYWGLMCHLRSQLHAERLYPPGSIYWIRSLPTDIADRSRNERRTYRATLVRCDDVREMFAEPRFTSRMVTDHVPGRYEEAIDVIRRGMAVQGRK
ncbi:hypothetical protein HK104_010373 [Borealophlyctis nickersoniae]|nr:hypothetical protein HK104_010373 [Borealophlyctis nickersoniae]